MSNPSMTRIKHQLFDAFRNDHALLGRGLYEIAALLRAGDEPGTRAAALQLAQSAGAHIAFEEKHFYPALAPFLSTDEIDEMYSDHENGRQLLRELVDLPAGRLADNAYRSQLIEKIEAMEHHVSECGELFGAMGGLDNNAQAALLQQLEQWRIRAPSWLDLSPFDSS